MKNLPCLLTFWFAAAFSLVPLPSHGQDAEPPKEEAKPEEPVEDAHIVTEVGGYITPIHPNSSFEVTKEQWEKITAPPTLLGQDAEPTKVWLAPGGYFGSFDRGEFGGELCYADAKEKKWTLLAHAHIQDIARYDDRDAYLAVGGLAHDREQGSAWLLTLDKKGNWKTRKVFQSSAGVPSLLGYGNSNWIEKQKVESTLVVGLNAFDLKTRRQKPVLAFGIAESGTSYFMGAVDPAKSTHKPEGDSDAKEEGAADPFAPKPAPHLEEDGAAPEKHPDPTAEESGPPEADLVLKLRDGSTFRGSIHPENTLRFRTKFGDINVPFPQLWRVSFTGEERKALLSFRNGDQLTGEALEEELPLKGANGESATPLEKIESIEVRPVDPKAALPLVRKLRILNSANANAEEVTNVLAGAVARDADLIKGVAEVELLHVYDAASPPMRRNEGEPAETPGAYSPMPLVGSSDFILSFGPYEPLEKGRYLVVYRFQFLDESGGERVCFLDVCHNEVTFSGLRPDAELAPAHAWSEIGVPVDVPDQMIFEYRFWPHGKRVAHDRVYVFRINP